MENIKIKQVIKNIILFIWYHFTRPRISYHCVISVYGLIKFFILAAIILWYIDWALTIGSTIYWHLKFVPTLVTLNYNDKEKYKLNIEIE